MKRTIDYQLDELYDDKEHKTLFGYSTQTLNKNINDIEKKYFNGEKIYHGLTNSANNSVIFRAEIKGLLLLLLKLEINNTFSNRKTMKKGVSDYGIEKILKSFNMAFGGDILKDYEYNVLTKFCDESALDLYEQISNLKQSLSRLMIVAAIKYNDYPSGNLHFLENKLNEISSALILSSKGAGFINKKYLCKTLDLKEAFIAAINIISDDLYFIDDKTGIVLRKVVLLADSENSTDYYDLICEHLKFDPNDKYHTQKEFTENEIIEGGSSIEELRNRLEVLLNKYYKSKYPPNNKIFMHPYDEEKVEERINEIKKHFKNHISNYVKLKKLCMGRLSPEEYDEIKNNDRFLFIYNTTRSYLMRVEIFGLPFREVLTIIENKIDDIIASNDSETKCMHVLSDEELIERFAKNARARAEIVKKEFAKFENLDNLDGDFLSVENNIKDLDRCCEELIKNMISIIHKNESEKTKEKDVLTTYQF